MYSCPSRLTCSTHSERRSESLYPHPYHPQPRSSGHDQFFLYRRNHPHTRQCIIELPKSPRLCSSISIIAKHASQWLSPHTNLAAFQKGDQREAECTRSCVGVRAAKREAERTEVTNSCFVQGKTRFVATLYPK